MVVVSSAVVEPQKFRALPGDANYGRLSLLSQLYCDTKYVSTLRSGMFTPPPKVQRGSHILFRVPILFLFSVELLPNNF